MTLHGIKIPSERLAAFAAWRFLAPFSVTTSGPRF
jgi:hypothetical protein